MKNYSTQYRPVGSFEFEHWHAWVSQNGVYLSDENTKTLRELSGWDAAINWLFLNDQRPAARAMNLHVKEAQSC